MSEAPSEMARAVRSLETVKSAKKFLPTFFSRAERRKQKGIPLSWVMVGIPTELTTYFGIACEWPENYGALCASRLVSTRYCEEAEAEGYANDLCSYVRNTMGYCRRVRDLGMIPPEAPLEGMGEPTMLIGSGHVCDPRYKWFQAIATHYFSLPIYISDPVSPVRDTNVEDEDIANHFRSQIRADLKAQITFLEQQTNKKLDNDRFREVMKNSQEALKFWTETLELCRAVPAPMNAQDYFAGIIPQYYMMGEPEAVEFYHALRDEVKARVDKGMGCIPNEKFRLVWFAIPPWYNLGLFNYLESFGVVFPIVATYHVGPYFEVDLSDPIEALVERTWKRALWSHKHGCEAGVPEICNPSLTGVLGVGAVRQWVKDYKLDGAVMHQTRSCRALTVGLRHVRNELAKIDIPSMSFESDLADPRAWSDAAIKAQFAEFLEILAAKERRQQGEVVGWKGGEWTSL